MNRRDRMRRGIIERKGQTMNEVTVRGKDQNAAEPLAFTIDEFAAAYRFSRGTLYNLWRAGEGPETMRARGRVLISRVAAEKWRVKMEAKSRGGK